MENVVLKVAGRSIGRGRVVRDVLGKTRGLMFRWKPITLIFENSSEQLVPLHMWFVFFPIDVVYLDNKQKIVELVERFLPFTVHMPEKRARYIIEMPKGSIKKHKLRTGTTIHFEG